MENNEFGAYLKKLRRSKGFTQEKLAQRLNISNKAVSHWETGASRPRGSILLRLCALLDTTADRLLSGGRTAEVISDTVIESKRSIHEPTNLENLKKIKYGHLSFLPAKIKENGNYLCTWALQNRVANKLGLAGRGTIRQRDVMNAELLFGADSYYHVYDKAIRPSLYFLLDDGWDVPYGTASDNPVSRSIFGSLEPDIEKFGALGNSGEKILAALCKKAGELGYAGLGLWVSPQRPMLGADAYDDPKIARDYWIQKAKQSQKAGVTYWKVDWGKGDADIAYRTMITDCVKEYAPNLLVEHAVPLTPFEIPTAPNDEIATRMKDTLKISDYFRTYDLCRPFGDALTLCRIANLLKGYDPTSIRKDVRGIVNVESQPMVAAGLGFSMGVMEYSKTVEAVLRWQQIAPPFSVRHGSFLCSNEEITDRLYFSTAPIWWLRQYINREVSVTTPMITARNTKLPQVSYSGLAPRIAACSHPNNHALAISSMKRTVDPNREIITAADVTAFPDSLRVPIGIFGYFNNVTLDFPLEIPKKATVYAQCLLSGAAVDITDTVAINGHRLTISGRLLRSIGHSVTETECDYEPAVLIKLMCA